MTDIVKFDFKGHQVRVVDGKEEWIAKDACEVLGYSNTRDALAKHVDDDEKGVAICDTPGGPQEMATVTESGLYSLILRSRKPQAKAFKRWVTHEVLPEIRRKGYYVSAGDEMRVFKALQTQLESQGQLVAALVEQNRLLVARLDQVESRHPYGLLGRHSAKVLRGQFVAIRNLKEQLGDARLPLTIYRGVDDQIRRMVGYPNERGASWANATHETGTRAFSESAKMIEALRKEVATKAKCKPSNDRQLQLKVVV